GGFELGAAGWSLAPQANIDPNVTNAHLGNDSLKLVATGPWQGTWQYAAVTAGQSYNVTAWGRSTSSGGYITLASFDSNGTEVGAHFDLIFGGTGSWTSMAGTYIAPPGAVRLAVVPQSSGSGTYWFDDLSLTRTSHPLASTG